MLNANNILSEPMKCSKVRFNLRQCAHTPFRLGPKNRLIRIRRQDPRPDLLASGFTRHLLNADGKERVWVIAKTTAIDDSHLSEIK